MTVDLDISYPADLPITARRQELLETITANQVVIVAGETGSGKSTQLPKMCLELGRGAEALIGHTQPRRLAARAVAARVADELGTTVGGLVGSTIRFDDRVGPDTRLQVMTDGILLARTRRDPDLRRYDTLILDEAHERSLNIDFLLGYLTRLLPRRPDLKVIVTSATIDTERFADHFAAPVIEVSGRSYPVEMRYRPFGTEDDDDRDQNDAICDAVTELWTEDASDTLVFLSGEREIHDAADALAALKLPDTEILPLYARLSAAEQQRIFARHDKRRVVLATNVAETSLTVPGIRSVVDVGTARISRYSRRLKVQRLPIEPISKASADQRAGRCGRVAPGVCIRLYAEPDFDQRPDFTEPEILRTNLASVILQMAALRLGPVADFPFVEPPDTAAITDGIRLLEELAAFDAEGDLTELGRKLARLPVDPRLGRMILEAEAEGCIREVLIIASAMAIQDPREYPSDKRTDATAAHRRFGESGSDFIAYVDLWEYLREARKASSGNAYRRMCRAEFLHFLRIREWQDLDRQLRKIVRDMGLSISSRPDDHDAIHRSVLAGLLSHVGMREGDRDEYRGARDARFLITRDSALRRNRPDWVMAGELTETNRLWGRTAARIEPEWAERIGSHLVKRSHGDPRWDRRRGRAVCTERVTLYGLPLIADRTVPYAQVDQSAARDLFIDHGLVSGEIDLPVPILDANRAALADTRSLAERARRSDLVIGDHLLFDHYDRVVGSDVTSVGHFNRWRKRTHETEPDPLRFDPETLLGDVADDVDSDAYPDFWPGIALDIPLTYEFNPESATDGVMAHFDVRSLNQIGEAGFDWQVPGFRRQLVEALLRTLPKPIRRELSPVAETAAAIVATRDPAEGPLADVLAEEVRSRAGLPIEPTEFGWLDVPRNLRMTFAVFGEDGGLVAAGKDLGRLKAKVAGNVRVALSSLFGAIERSVVEIDDLGEIPETVEVDGPSGPVVGHPALVVENGVVALRVLDDPRAALDEHRRGVRALVLARLTDPRKALARRLPNDTSLALAGAARGRLVEVLDDCIGAAIDQLADEPGGPPRTGDALSSLVRRARDQVLDRATEHAIIVARALASAAAIRAATERLSSPDLDASVVDLRVHLDRLLSPGVATRLGSRLGDLERLLTAAEHRVERMTQAAGRDAEHTATLAELETELATRAGFLGPERTEEIGWMLEELRVGLFAQQVGTRTPVSVERVRRALRTNA